MKRMTYVTEKGEILFHPKDLPDDEGMTITQLAEDGRFKALEQIAEILANREQADELGVYGKWIPVSERLPEKYGSYLVAWKPCNMSEEYVVKRSGSPHFYEILEYDPDDESGWTESIEQATGEYEILAWMPLPEPYRESEE